MFPSQFHIQSSLVGLFSSIRGLRIPELHRLMVHLLLKLLGCTIMQMKISLQRCNRHFQVHQPAGKADDVLKIDTRVSRPPAPVLLPKRGKILRNNSCKKKNLQKKISRFCSKRNISRFVLWHFECVQILGLVFLHKQWPDKQQWLSLFLIWQRFDWQRLHRLPFPQSFVYFVFLVLMALSFSSTPHCLEYLTIARLFPSLLHIWAARNVLLVSII